jgi:hypothetical protein
MAQAASVTTSDSSVQAVTVATQSCSVLYLSNTCQVYYRAHKHVSWLSALHAIWCLLRAQCDCVGNIEYNMRLPHNLCNGDGKGPHSKYDTALFKLRESKALITAGQV